MGGDTRASEVAHVYVVFDDKRPLPLFAGRGVALGD